MNTRVPTAGIRPWYREPWPWFLMAGPLIVVIAGVFTAWLAISSSDGLVTDDYYKKGLAVGETLARSRQAEALGLKAHMGLQGDSVTVRLTTKADSGFVAPARIRITLAHPTRAGVDQNEVLKQDGEHYRGRLNLPSSGHWLVLIEDEAKSWRLMAAVSLPASGETVIGGEMPADIRNQ